MSYLYDIIILEVIFMQVNNRLFEIIYILMEKKIVTANELAKKFEVSTRAIYRDIEILSSASCRFDNELVVFKYWHNKFFCRSFKKGLFNNSIFLSTISEIKAANFSV